MPHRAPRLLTLVLATAGACLVTTAASAQTAPSSGRYLTWANRPAGTTPADVTAAQNRARTGIIPRRVAPSQSPYQPVMQAPVSNIATSRGLTPASAWIGPRVTPAYAPGAPDPVGDVTAMVAPPIAPTVSQPAPQPQPVQRAAVDPMAPRRDAPVLNMPRAPQAPAAQQAPTPTQAPVQQQAAADPMAPRQDARIFQMQQNAPQGQAPAALPAPAASGQSGPRYYSVHREAGHRPDPTALPEPVYFDSVTLDLADQPAQELPLRDAQGRRRVVPNQDPTLP
ncbi:hypothetical protein ACETK8_06160 [Brevundimonas staleyi]|uniref:Uncharacterized protein n=1 Tax=Brevundimonas staleyi TaxID=74326 RepID=A0ABW0FLR4_9CAUL